MKRRIVIADDDPTIVSLVALRLGMSRFEVLSAADGDQALNLIRASEPLMAILDMQMPRKSGMDVLGVIKADPQISKLPVMMLTGERDPDAVMQAVGAGANDYMVKPFHPDRLLERVSRLIKSSAMIWGAHSQAASQTAPNPVWEL